MNADHADVLLEFLEIAFHSILHTRKLYPKDIYKRKIIHGVPVYMSLFPELNDYFKNILNSIREVLSKDEYSIDYVNVLYLNEAKVPIEKYNIQIDEIKNDIFS